MNSSANKPPSVLIIGPHGAGKKTILYTAKHGESATIVPIIGIDFEKLIIDETPLMVWSVGGRSAFRPLWRQHYNRMSAFIFVVDSNDHQRIDEAREQLHQLTNNENFREKSILIFANKQDLPDAMNSDQLRDELHLEQLKKTIKWHVQPASALQNQGLHEGFKWLMDAIRERNDPIKPLVETLNDTVTMKNGLISKISTGQLPVFIRKVLSLSLSSIESVLEFVNIKMNINF